MHRFLQAMKLQFPTIAINIAMTDDGMIVTLEYSPIVYRGYISGMITHSIAIIHTENRRLMWTIFTVYLISPTDNTMVCYSSCLCYIGIKYNCGSTCVACV